MGIGFPVEGREWRLSGKDGSRPPMDLPDDFTSFGSEEVKTADTRKNVPVPMGRYSSFGKEEKASVGGGDSPCEQDYWNENKTIMAGELSIFLDEGEYQRLLNAIAKLNDIEKDAVVSRALQEAGNMIKKQGQSNLQNSLSREPQNVRMRKGNLQKSFKTKVYKKKGKAHIGFTKKGHHAHLVNFGTMKRWTKKGAYRGSVSKDSPMTGSRFWSRAFEQKKTQAGREIIDSVIKSVKKIGWR